MKILTLCLGNICRSPMAEGILRHLARERGIAIATDSAGTNGYHIGQAPDPRAQAAMRKHGIDISDLRGRQFTADDLAEFDLILAMDSSNLRNVVRSTTNQDLAAKARLMMDFAPAHPEREVPDPYYGGEEGFDQVYHMLVQACNGVLDRVENGKGIRP